MRIRTAMLLVILVVLGMFAALNWTVFSAPTDLNLLFSRIEAPLGVILLGFTAAITVLYLAFLAWLETAALLEARRNARELTAQRDLAQRAEASRYAELREFLAAELAELRTTPEATARDLIARIERAQTELRADIVRAGNTLAAYIGELEERLDRGDRSGPPAARSRP
jgi:uncharacterized integral membrane protein